MDVNTPSVTSNEVSASLVVEKLSEKLAFIVILVPTAKPVARPVTLMLAFALSEELQPTKLVRSSVEPLSYTPVTLNCFVVPTVTTGSTGVIERDCNAEPSTVTVVEPVCAVSPAKLVVAVIVLDPAVAPLTKPLPLSTVAMAG